LLGDVVSEFCDTDKSALSHRRFSSAGVIPHRPPSLQQSKTFWVNLLGRCKEGCCLLWVSSHQTNREFLQRRRGRTR
jgi:hypothetical protein